MYNEKIEALIAAALADGVLTEKEKQILFKNAHNHGKTKSATLQKRNVIS